MEHIPVFLEESVTALVRKKTGLYLDATYGRGGHAEAILHQLCPPGKLYALDRDSDAAENARRFCEDPRFQFLKLPFSQMNRVREGFIAEREDWDAFDGILFDLGVSSPQLDHALRGFSFSKDGPLDMRMDPEQSLTAATWLANANEETITSALATLGEERFAARIAKQIVARRRHEPFVKTLQLAQLIMSCVPREANKHPATRSFQAIRMVVNDEVNELVLGLEAASQLTKVGGRLVIITFHGLEERIVRRVLGNSNRQLLQKGWIRVEKLKSGPVARHNNPRARSATLHVFEKFRNE